jgi:HEAT repeats
MSHSAICCRFLLSAVAAALTICPMAGVAAKGDTFVLVNGGRIEGQWLNQDEQPPKEYLVLTSSGLKASVQVTQVREVLRQSADKSEYARRAAAAADTPEGQWQLAEWCRQQSLFDERRLHLRRVIELDPNHSYARRALGFQFLEGQWVTQEDFRRGEGYELYKGKWRTPQEIEILEEQARLDQAQKDWLKKLRRYRAELDDPARAKLGLESLTGIKDPIAVRPIVAMMVRERVRQVKMLYADVLAGIDSSDAVGALVERVLYDPDEEMFHYCLARLIDRQPPRLADPLIAALKNKNNATVNRAAAALGRIGDPEAIGPLIDALITTHTQYIPGRNPDSTTATFSGGQHSVSQGGGPEVRIMYVRNQHVLDALTKLTGASFDYDQKSWHYWHAQEKKAREAREPVADARRQ